MAQCKYRCATLPLCDTLNEKWQNRSGSGKSKKQQGLERLDQIKYAILERDGKISIIPKSHS